MNTAGADQRTIEALVELERSLTDPEVRASRVQLERVFADEFVEFETSGAMLRRSQVLDILPSQPMVERHMLRPKVDWLSPHAAHVTSLRQVVAADGTIAHSLRSSIWKRKDGRWQLAFHQSTPTMAV